MDVKQHDAPDTGGSGDSVYVTVDAGRSFGTIAIR